MPKPGATGFRRLIDATGYSARGFASAWRNESAFRQELLIGMILVPCAFWLGSTPAHVALLLATLGVVIVTELLNSAIESVVDRIGMEHHELSGRAKDMGSAAVFTSLAIVVAVWSISLWGRLAQ